jgi:protein-S-isoprenylcysteine O-methyltransferase Ste14
MFFVGITVFLIKPLHLFLFLVAARFCMDLILTRNIRRKGQKSGYVSTLILSLCYIFTLLFAVMALRGKTEICLFFVLGIIVMETSVLLRMVALWHLGEYFSYEIRLTQDHKLIMDGIYGIVRHPLHLAFFGEVLGIAVISANSFSIIPLIALAFAIYHRNQIEEKALEKRFGKVFCDYRERVPGMNIIEGIARKLRN